MKMIDANELLKELEKVCNSLQTKDTQRADLIMSGLYVAKRHIQEMPTVNLWKEVYDELTKNEMLCGKYDARTSDAEHFINGVWTVMEYIAERAGHHDEFDKMFMQNVIKSEEKALNAKEKTQ
jgi:hypothetical protein